MRAIPKEELMDTISFVFQNSRLLKGSILDNVRLGRPQATEAEVLAALKAAQCKMCIRDRAWGSCCCGWRWRPIRKSARRSV